MIIFNVSYSVNILSFKNQIKYFRKISFTYVETLPQLFSILRQVLGLHRPYILYAHYQHWLQTHFHLPYVPSEQLEHTKRPKLLHVLLIFLNMHHVMLNTLILFHCFPVSIISMWIRGVVWCLVFVLLTSFWFSNFLPFERWL